MNLNELKEFYSGKRVFITGDTGFKGAYLARILRIFGADVTGYALDPPTDPSVFALTGLDGEIRHIKGDVRDFERMRAALSDARPEVVFHLAAQPIVRESYRIPRETFEINIMGTVNLLEAVRETGSVRSVVNVTTDKVYQNLEERRGYREDDPLDGYDPYSNSKSCSDLVTHSYRSSFFGESGPAVSTARAGNVIGGGDFAKDRLIPDCVRAAMRGETIILRNPDSVRPVQHVLEPLGVSLLIAAAQERDRSLAGAYNVGPGPEDAVTAGHLADLFTEAWGDGASWTARPDGGPHEAGLLMLDSSKICDELGWRPVWRIGDAVRKTVEWSRVYAAGGDLAAETDRQIGEYFHV